MDDSGASAPRPRRFVARLAGMGAALVALGASIVAFMPSASLSAPAMPPLLQDLPANYQQATRELGERAARRFPPGTDEAAMIAELRGEGFSVDAGTRVANWERKKVIGVEIARIWWDAAGGKVTEVHALRGGIYP